MKKLIQSCLKVLIAGCLLMNSSFLHAQSIPSLSINQVTDLYARNNDSVYVINFWSTWCVPCLEEIPHFQRIAKKHANKKVKLLLVSLDVAAFYPKKLKEIVRKRNITAPVAWLNETNADKFCPAIDSSWSGSIPATIFVNTRTGYRAFFEDQLDERKFEVELLKAIRGNTESLAKRERWLCPLSASFSCAETHYEKDKSDYRNLNDDLVTFCSTDSLILAIDGGWVKNIVPVDSPSVAVLITNGNRTYIYSNLQKVSVKPGDQISKNQTIGIASRDVDNKHFEIDFMFIMDDKNMRINSSDFTKRTL